MIIQKILETQLDLTDPMDIIDPDLIGMCTRHLIKKFVGRCFKSCLVVKINKIIRHSRRYMSEDLSGSAYIYVTFEVDGITFSKGEIINGCNILKIEADGRIHAKSKYAGVQVRQDSAMGIYKEGQIVPFITRRVLYNPAQLAISVEALPFVPFFPPLKIYKITSGLVDDDAEKIQSLFDKLGSIVGLISQRVRNDPNEKQALDFFQKLIYPFKQPTDYKLPGFEKRKLSTIASVTSGYIYQPVESNITNQEFYYSPHEIKEEGHEIKEEDVYEKDLMFIIDKLLNRAIQHYNTLSEFVDTYPTFAKVQEYKDVWRMFNMLKK